MRHHLSLLMGSLASRWLRMRRWMPSNVYLVQFETALKAARAEHIRS